MSDTPRPVTWSITIPPPPEPPEGWVISHYAIRVPDSLDGDNEGDRWWQVQFEDFGKAVEYYAECGCKTAYLWQVARPSVKAVRPSVKAVRRLMSVFIESHYEHPDDEWGEWPDLSDLPS